MTETGKRLDKEYDWQLTANCYSVISERLKHYIREVPEMTGDEWANKYRVMGDDSVYDRWDSSRTPYLVEIANTISSTDPAHQQIIIAKGAQLGITECYLNECLKRIHLDPCGMLIYMPKQDLIDEWARDRLLPALRQEPFHDNKAIKPRANTVTFPGGKLRYFGTGSSSNLSNVSAPLIVGDEVARFDENIKQEGDFLSLARARTKTFGDRRKLVMLSTPILQHRGEGSFYSYMMMGDWRTYRTTCQHCKGEWSWKIDQIVKVEKEKETYYAFKCPHCEKLTHDGEERDEAVRRGYWAPTQEGWEGTTSFQLSGLYVPSEWVKLSEFYIEYEKVRSADAQSIASFMNLTLGEFYEEAEARTPEASEMMKRMTIHNYKSGEVPEGVSFLTAAVDVQKGWLSWEVRGWGERMINFSIARGEWEIDIADTARVATEIRELFATQFQLKGDPNSHMKIWSCAIDAGYNASQVYPLKEQFAQATPTLRGWDIPRHSLIVTRGETDRRKTNQFVAGEPGALNRRGGKYRSWRMDTVYAKKELYRTLNLPADSDEAVWAAPYAPVDYPEEYYEELKGEELIVEKNPKTGRTTQIFKKIPKQPNESLDKWVMTRFVAHLIGADGWEPQHWKSCREREVVVKDAPARKRMTDEEREKRRAELEKRREEKERARDND